MDQLDSLFAQFMRERKFTGAAAATLRGYESSYKLFRKLMPGVRPEEINKDLIINFFEKLQTRERDPMESKKKIGVENTTLYTYKNKLGSFFNWLVKKGVISTNPFKGLKLAKPVERNRKYLLHDEIQKIFATIGFSIHCKNNLIKKRNLLIIAFPLLLGLRKGEILGLKLTDIYLDKKLLLVRGESSKSKRNRSIPINNEAFSFLIDYLEERKRRAYKNEYLFVSDGSDARFTEHGLKHMLAKVIKHVGFSFHMHQFRHTFAVNMRRNGSDVVEMKEVLGHADIRMTYHYLGNFPVEDCRIRLNSLSVEGMM